MFECKFNRDPKFENVAWFKDDEQLNEDDSRIKFLNDGKRQFLIIKHSKLSDIGNYRIKAVDVESTAWLKVRGNNNQLENIQNTNIN
jgi:hypothetical protein